jgi:hypothetical protein
VSVPKNLVPRTTGVTPAWLSGFRWIEKTTLPTTTLAWLLLTAEETRLRDPQRVLKLALKAVELNDGNHANDLDTLARAYLKLGDRRDVFCYFGWPWLDWLA